jgi:Metallo-beta-lactamase superfamily
MTTKPVAVEIRSYQVGFGDCFLVSFVYAPNDRRHVLIDFGTTRLPRRGKPSVHMPKIAADVARIVGASRLTAVVATHRHADHISGFATDGKTGKSGLVIKGLRPRIVLQPWTEDPAAARDANQATNRSRRQKTRVDALAAMNGIARRVQRLANSSPFWMSSSVRKELSLLGEENISNRSAIENLIAMGNATGGRSQYLRHGDSTGLESLLPGVKVHVLGPPDLTQTDGIRKQRSSDPQEFWHLVAGVVSAPDRGAIGAKRARGASQSVPIEARWFRDRLQASSGQALLEIVRQLDDQMNNTSLVLLFEVFGKKLLFPGDAQLENWTYALVDAPNATATARLLEGVDFYKVGHHGSLNATPRTLLWERFKKRAGKQLRTMVSTMPGVHGAKEKKSEVPRETLLQGLRRGSKLKSTVDLEDSELFHLTTIEP